MRLKITSVYFVLPEEDSNVSTNTLEIAVGGKELRITSNIGEASDPSFFSDSHTCKCYNY